jgi:protein-S-isoprenylcysteine O-methyltransferase Ste14
MARILILLFSAASYSLFLVVFLYLVAFLANLQNTTVADALPILHSLVPYSIDQGRAAGPLVVALLADLSLIALFGLQHSVMARQGFKKLWTRIVPKEAERSFYVFTSSIVLGFILWQWRPIATPVIWHADSALGNLLAWGVMLTGLVILLWSTFLIDHFDLFGLKQAWYRFRDRPLRHPKFVTPYLYRFVRHPLYVGWFLIFWGTPAMSFGHLLFAIGMSAYILIAIRFEERDLVSFHGEAYRQYKEQVPMVLPGLKRRFTGLTEIKSRPYQ